MSKKLTYNFIELISSIVVLGCFIGFDRASQVLYEILAMFNYIFVELYESTLINEILNNRLTYFIVGLILTMFCFPKGKLGHWIGKIFYVIVSYFVSLILNFMSNMLFKI